MNLFVCSWLPGTYVGPFNASRQDFEPATLTIASKATPWKSQAFMEIVTLKRFSIELDRENVKDFDLMGR
jgi:hypothetical protein